MVIALGSRCSHMIKTVEFGPGAVPEFIRDDLESKRSKFQPARKSDSFSITMYWLVYYLVYYFSQHSI